MNRILAGITLVLVLSLSGAAQTFLTEDFSAGTGATLPGWTQNIFVAPLGTELWHFDNPGARTITAPQVGNVAIFDSDFVSAAGGTEDVALESPPFDVSMATVVLLDLDQYHRPLGTSSTVMIDVFDGAMWNNVFTDSAGFGGVFPDTTPIHSQIDITAAAGGSTVARIRFRWMGTWDWWWTIDNVTVRQPALIDVGVTSVDNPIGGPTSCGGLSSMETITVSVSNFGSTTLPAGTVIPIEYVLDGGTPVQEMMTTQGPIAFGAAEQYTFTTLGDFSLPGVHLVDSKTNFGDIDPTNDGIVSHMVGNPTISTFPWVENFDSSPSNGTTIPPTGWVQDQADATGTDSDWFFRNTPTTSANTGPPADHTTGVSGQGYYAYVEDSVGNFPMVSLLSPCLDFFTTANPALQYWLHSNDANGGTNQNFMAIDVISYTTGMTTMDVVPPVGHLGNMWTLQVIDLSAFAGQVIRIRFRGRSDGGSFTCDQAIDDVRVFNAMPSNGQAPQPNLAVMDINSSNNGGGFPVTSGNSGPYFTTAQIGNPFTFTFTGEMNQPVVLFVGPLNPGAASYPNVGQLDIGGPIDPMTGVPTGIAILANGLVASGTNLFFNTGVTGTALISFTTPTLPLGVLTTFQAIIFNSTINPVALTNAVEVTVVP